MALLVEEIARAVHELNIQRTGMHHSVHLIFTDLIAERNV